MPVQKLIAKTMNEGLKRIREEIASDALILKTVKRNGMVEFFVETEEPEASFDQAEDEPKSKSSNDREANGALHSEYRDARLRMLSAMAERADAKTSIREEAAMELPPRQRQTLMGELTVKGLIEGLELTPAVGAQLLGYKRIDEVVDNLALMVRPATHVTEGIHAFVGPAGGGKTTSLVKLVTQQIMQHGADACAIINCDRFRMGAKEQMTRLGELMGVDVLHVGSGLDLNQAIANVHKRRFIAIDMPGLGMQEKQLDDELFRLSSSHYDISRFLVMPANLQFKAMQLIKSRFAAKKGTSCLLTRLDESPSLGAALSFLAHSELPLAFTSDGPHIPKDIAPGRGDELVQRALRILAGGFAKAGMSDLTKGHGNKSNGSRSRSVRGLEPSIQQAHPQQEKVMDL